MTCDVENPVEKTLFISAGDSESGGSAPVSDLLPTQTAANPSLPILEAVSLQWQPLTIGTNNNTDHQGIASPQTHGWEVELANQLANDPNRCGCLVQTGQGGSTTSQWLDPNDTNGWIQKRNDRLAAAKSKPFDSICIMLSLGINDALTGVSPQDYRTQMQQVISDWLALCPGAMIVVPEIRENVNGFTAFNAEIVNLTGIVTVPTAGLSVLPSNGHYDQAAFSQLGSSVYAQC